MYDSSHNILVRRKPAAACPFQGRYVRLKLNIKPTHSSTSYAPAQMFLWFLLIMYNRISMHLARTGLVDLGRELGY